VSKERYQFEIAETDREHFTDIVTSLIGFCPRYSISAHSADGVKYYYYFLDLSKYELLYLRLAAKNGRFLNLTDHPNGIEDMPQQSQSDSTTQMV